MADVSTIRGRSARYFAASVATTGISLLTMPLTTRILGPADYGVLALGTAIAGIGATVAGLGPTVVLASRWHTARQEEQVGIASTLLAFGAVVALVWVALASVAYLSLRSEVAILAAVPGLGLALLLAGTAISPLWTLASEVLTLEGRAGAFSATSVLQGAVTAAATLVALFAFDLGAVSLFVGLFAGGVVGALVGAAVLSKYLRPRFELSLRGDLAQVGFLLATGLETVQPLIERVLLSRFAGFRDLGLYTHSQRYRVLALQGAKAVSRGVWPVTLAEAREVGGAFQATRRTWNALHVGLAATGIVAVALGDFAISLLTNDKFTAAAIFLGPWFVVLLLQFSARPEMGVLYASGAARTVARIAQVANSAAIVATVTLIPIFGIWGALAAVALQAVVFRVVIRVPARRFRTVPFQDGWVLAGIGLIGATVAAKERLDPGLGGSVAVAAGGEAVLLVLALPVLAETLRSLPRVRTFRAG